MKEDSFHKWLKSDLKKEREARKHCSFIVLAVLETLLKRNQTSEFNNY